MDLLVAFFSMFLLVFGITALGLGLFSAYFGAGKSRAIGVILGLIGIVVILIFYLLMIDHFGYGWAQSDVTDSILGVIGMMLGMILSMVLVIVLMMVIKEDEPPVPGTKDFGGDLAVDESKDEPARGVETIPADDSPEDADESAEDVEPDTVPAPEEPIPEPPIEEVDGPDEAEPEPSDDMSEFLKDKEEKKLVKEDWEKVEEEDLEKTGEEQDAGPSEEEGETGPEPGDDPELPTSEDEPSEPVAENEQDDDTKMTEGE